MKFMKLKFLIPSIIIIFVGILAGLYFIGGLSVNIIQHDNIEFNEDDFINFHSIQYDEDGNLIEGIEFDFDNNKKIAENDKYEMIFDEETTISKIVDKASGKTVFQTADPESPG